MQARRRRRVDDDVSDSWLTLGSRSRSRPARYVALAVVGCRELFFIEVAVGLGSQLELQVVVVLAVRDRPDLDIVQGHDAGERGDAAHELAELVIAADE